MTLRFSAAVLLLASAAFAGCGTKSRPGADGKGVPAAQEGPAAGEPGPGGQEAHANGGAGLLQGRFTVLGLRVPEGMFPVTGVLGFFRYGGIFPVEQVAEFVRSQLSESREEREGAGHLFRQALLKIPGSGGGPAKRLAIRVSKAPGGGALMDVWIEAKPDGDRAAGGSSATPLPMTEIEREERERAKAETRRVMEKVSRHEPLTPEDLKSQFFE
jgi:hypothetical protein